ncbi:uncharacterized protein LOC126481745 [Schistocerca serialis cubense]|uniref:uncharacterized protein LOC126481745 n=1 Tax=Schistocerca serialis cubense TaxID=2023355 RepID=UPI00214F322D|nr:uncharacterized protein LOC126481745 [Schistocerca serialis cubense]
MTSWSKQNTLHFIEAVRRHPCIWDVKLRDYKNTQKRYDEWEEIAKAFNVSKKECEDKWHNLKSQYSRELAKRKSSKGTGSATSNVYHTSWYAFESMQFIRDNYKPLSHRSTHEVVPVMEAPATEGDGEGEGEGSISFPFDVTEMEEVTFATLPEDIVEVETTPVISVPPHESGCATVSPCTTPSPSGSGRSSALKRARRDLDEDREGLLQTLRKVGDNLAGRKRDQFTHLGDLVANKLRFLYENGHTRIMARLENGIYRCLQEANDELIDANAS